MSVRMVKLMMMPFVEEMNEAIPLAENEHIAGVTQGPLSSVMVWIVRDPAYPQEGTSDERDATALSQ